VGRGLAVLVGEGRAVDVEVGDGVAVALAVGEGEEVAEGEGEGLGVGDASRVGALVAVGDGGCGVDVGARVAVAATPTTPNVRS
jgi:hypothetical protein